jgi:hypothetical protein
MRFVGDNMRFLGSLGRPLPNYEVSGEGGETLNLPEKA